LIKPNAAYLITGGLRGFGLATAKWLVGLGARHLVLVSRSGEAPAEELDALRASGADVIALAADVASADGAAKALREAGRFAVPLRGIFHAAGVIDDALIAQLELDRIRRVFDPKVLGAWHLHELTRGTELDFFVLYSSFSAVLGSVGQAHYAGANGALTALAELRRSEGLPALTIGWGAIADAGYLARHADVARFLTQSCVNLVPVNSALEGLGDLLSRDCSNIVYADVRWPVLARANPGLTGMPRLAALTESGHDESRSGQHLRARILATD